MTCTEAGHQWNEGADQPRMTKKSSKHSRQHDLSQHSYWEEFMWRIDLNSKLIPTWTQESPNLSQLPVGKPCRTLGLWVVLVLSQRNRSLFPLWSCIKIYKSIQEWSVLVNLIFQIKKGQFLTAVYVLWSFQIYESTSLNPEVDPRRWTWVFVLECSLFYILGDSLLPALKEKWYNNKWEMFVSWASNSPVCHLLTR